MRSTMLAMLALFAATLVHADPALAAGGGGTSGANGGIPLWLPPASYAYHPSDRLHGFRTSQCKTAACYQKHPDGTWTHPLTRRKDDF